MDDEGRMPAKTQTAYVLAFRFGLLPPAQRPLAAAALARNVEENGIGTGFLAVGHLLPVLSEWGYDDLVYRRS